MQNKNQLAIIPPEIIQNKIFEIRNVKVMLDRDLAELYEVETKVLNQTVKRNIKRFPENFMFQLNKLEKNELVTNCDRFETLKHSTFPPYAFTEHGVAMLSSVLNSERAIQINILIINAFIKLRQMLAEKNEALRKVEELDQKTNINTEKIRKHDSRLHFIDVVVEGLTEDVNKLNKLLALPEAKGNGIGFRDRKISKN